MQHIEKVQGELNHFIIEEFIPHLASHELYVCIQSVRQGSQVYFCHEGGVDIGDVDAKAERLLIPVDEDLTEVAVEVNFKILFM